MLDFAGKAIPAALSVTTGTEKDSNSVSLGSQPLNNKFSAELSRAHENISDQVASAQTPGSVQKVVDPEHPNISIAHGIDSTVSEDTDVTTVTAQNNSYSSANSSAEHQTALSGAQLTQVDRRSLNTTAVDQQLQDLSQLTELNATAVEKTPILKYASGDALSDLAGVTYNNLDQENVVATKLLTGTVQAGAAVNDVLTPATEKADSFGKNTINDTSVKGLSSVAEVARIVEDQTQIDIGPNALDRQADSSENQSSKQRVDSVQVVSVDHESPMPLADLPVGNRLTKAQGTSAHAVTVAGHEFLRSVGSKQAGLIEPTLRNTDLVSTEALITEQAERNAGKQLLPNTASNEIRSSIGSNVSLQALSGTASPLSTATSPQETVLVNSAFMKTNGNTVKAGTSELLNSDKTTDIHSGGVSEATIAEHKQQHSAVRVDQPFALVNANQPDPEGRQEKNSKLIPTLGIRSATQLHDTNKLQRIQSLNGQVEVNPSNGYFATPSGIITATSPPSVTGLPSDLVSAPYTLNLDQPDADQPLIENLRWAVNEKLSRATINVSPAHLGPITVNVDLENQNMSVSIIANNVIAREAIDGLIPRMREHFANDGYTQVFVDVSSQQDQRGTLENRSGQSFEDFESNEETIADNEFIEEKQVSARTKDSTSLIDTYV